MHRKSFRDIYDEAGHWWEMTTRCTEEQQRNLTCAQFKEIVLQKYFLATLRDKNEVKFLELKQENMTFTDYDRKFEKLSIFVPHLVHTEER